MVDLLREIGSRGPGRDPSAGESAAYWTGAAPGLRRRRGHARARTACSRRISLGVLGNSGRFAAQTGQRTTVGHVILG
jgi:hypothetical protein